MDIAVVRTFNIFGPRQRDSGYGAVIPLFIRRIFHEQPPVVFGDGNQTRDYTYIDDVVRAYDLVLGYREQLTGLVNCSW